LVVIKKIMLIVYWYIILWSECGLWRTTM
jgi:hypothetical protein